MKKLIISLTLILACSFGYCQTNILELERVDGLWTKRGEQDPFNGDFIEKFENGELKGKGTFVNGQLEGNRIQYYPNGQKKTEKMYKEAYPHGMAKEFYEDGTLKQEGEFVKNSEQGTWVAYYPHGKKQAVLTFENGVQNGPYFEYNKEGDLIRQFYFKNGKTGYSDEFMKLINEASAMNKGFIPKEAIALYDEAIELNPTVADIYLFRGTAYSNFFEYEKAIENYDKALLINPNFMEAYANRGSAKINQYTSTGTLNPTSEQTESACADFNKAKELGDTSIGTEDMIYLYCKKNKQRRMK